MPPKVNKPYQPDGQECALLLLSLVHKKEKEIKREIARVRLAELTLKRLWSRQRLSDQFLNEVQEWLFRAGWVLVLRGYDLCHREGRGRRGLAACDLKTNGR